MPRATARTPLSCSFCGKAYSDVVKLVAGPGVSISNECVDLCTQLISQEVARTGDRSPSTATAAASHPPALNAWGALSDEELLAEMVHVHAAHENVDQAVAHHVAALRARGVTWARIDGALGMARQSAWERFSDE